MTSVKTKTVIERQNELKKVGQAVKYNLRTFIDLIDIQLI